MHLVQIDVIGLQAAQAALNFRHDMAARQSDVVGRDRFPHENVGVKSYFRREYQRLAPILDYAAGNFLRSAGRVNVSRIEEISAQLDVAVDDFACIGFIGLASERHTSKTQLRDLESGPAEPAIFHFLLFLRPPSLVS